MNIIVPIKQVPDTGINIQIKENQINESSLKWIISPYDEFALEESLKLKSQWGGKLFVISLGLERAKEALLTGLALGADEAIHLVTKTNPQDPLSVAEALAIKIKEISEISLIFCGKLSTDFNNFAVPQMLAHLLDFPFVSNVNQLEYKDDSFLLKRECGAGVEELLKAQTPLLISADKGLSQARYPSLPGIMKAKKKPFHTEKIDISPRFQIKTLKAPSKKSAPLLIEGSPVEQVSTLVKILREKEKLL
ncbi:MAG: electron transfer flavoprotein subunit beta/FixA family protein [Bdellovibrionales bacterium]|nr:electron transfer flavoprotein subunit beta/FixA family protein [Bdellovibrionales bacterium]